MNIAPNQLEKHKDIHYDLVLHILFNLPAKSILRFKLMSKFWLDEISNHDFHDKYLKEAKKKHNLLFCRNVKYLSENGAPNKVNAQWKSFNTKTLSRKDSFTTSGKILSIKTIPSQSMVCFLSSKDNTTIQASLYCFRTKNLFVLPMNPTFGFNRGTIVGFGIEYFSSTKSYKFALLYIQEHEANQVLPGFNCQVIEIRNSYDGNGNRTINCSRWRLVEEIFHDYVDNFHPPISINNISYWKAFNHEYILMFDFVTENFNITHYPNEFDVFIKGSENICLLDLHGELGLVEVCSKGDEGYCFTMVIWKLLDKGNNDWERVYRFSLNDARFNFMRRLSCVYIQDEEIIFSSKVCVIFYNLKTNTYMILDNDIPTNYSLVGMYHENLYI